MMDLPIELQNATDQTGDDKKLYIMVEDRIRDLAQGHTDITGAAVNLTQPSQDNETAYIFEATVVLYVRPENIAANEKEGDLEGALKGALDAVERQIRKKREKLRKY
jgi:ribosomal subunit interface protein